MSNGPFLHVGTIAHVDHGKNTLAATIIAAMSGHAEPPTIVASRVRYRAPKTPREKTADDHATIEKADDRRLRRNNKRLQCRQK